MNTLSDQLQTCIARIAALRTLKSRMDPASGVTVTIRRGAICQEDQVNFSEERFPTTVIETSDAPDANFATDIIDLMIASQVDSLKLIWTPSARAEVEKLTGLLAAAQKELAR